MAQSANATLAGRRIPGLSGRTRTAENFQRGESRLCSRKWTANWAEAPAQKPPVKDPSCSITLTAEQIGFGTAGALAEAVLHLHYIRRNFLAFAKGDVYVDHIFSGEKRSDLGAFLRVDRQAAAEVGNCSPPCMKPKLTRFGFEETKVQLCGIGLRPDILDLEAGEFYEIKSENPNQVQLGRRELTMYQCVLSCILKHRRKLGGKLKTSIVRGTKFTPPPSYRLFTGRLAGVHVKISIKMSRPHQGLLTYRFCIDAQVDANEVAKVLREDVLPHLRDMINKLREHGRRIEQLVLPPGQILVPVLPAPKPGSQPQPVPVYARDVFDELADRLFTSDELEAIALGLLLAPFVGIGLVLGGAALGAFLTEMGLTGAALGALLRGAGTLIVATARVQIAAAATGAMLLKTSEALAAAPPGSPNHQRAADGAARKARLAQDAAAAAARAATEAEAAARTIPAAHAALARETAKLHASAQSGELPPGLAGRVRTETAKLDQAASKAAKDPRPLLNKNNAAAKKAAGDAARASALAKVASGKLPSGGSAACDVTVERIRQQTELRHDPSGVGKLVATPDVRHPAGQTTLIVRNATRFPAEIFIAGSTCNQFAVAPGATSAEANIAPGTAIRLAARISDVTSKPPQFGFAFGSQPFQRGMRHRMKLEATD
jgi:hypothetical protein